MLSFQIFLAVMLRLWFSSFVVAGCACALRDGRIGFSWNALLASADNRVVRCLANNLAILVKEDNQALNVGEVESCDFCTV